MRPLLPCNRGLAAPGDPYYLEVGWIKAAGRVRSSAKLRLQGAVTRGSGSRVGAGEAGGRARRSTFAIVGPALRGSGRSSDADLASAWSARSPNILETRAERQRDLGSRDMPCAATDPQNGERQAGTRLSTRGRALLRGRLHRARLSAMRGRVRSAFSDGGRHSRVVDIGPGCWAAFSDSGPCVHYPRR